MKKLAILIFMSLAINSFGQDADSVPVKDDNQTTGCFISFDTKISSLQDEYITYSGLKFGFVKNHKFTVGLAGYGLTEKNTFNYTDELTNIHKFQNNISYGGLIVEYTFFPDLPLHVSLPVLIGGGKIDIKENVELNQYEFVDSKNREESYWATVEKSKFCVFEVGVLLELDLLKWMRLGFGPSYRYVIGNNLNSLPNADSDLSGFSFDINLKIGCF